MLALRTGRHAALFSLGRLEEADEEYREIEQLRPSAIDRAEATAVQVRSLSHRTRFAEAVELGLGALRACGIDVPGAGGFSAGLDDKFEPPPSVAGQRRPGRGSARRELSDPALLATSNLIDAVLPLGYFVADAPMVAWLAMEAVRIWIEHGPSRLLVGSAAHAAYQAGPQRDDYPARVPGVAAHRGARRGPRVRARHLTGAIHGRHQRRLVRADRERRPRRSSGP